MFETGVGIRNPLFFVGIVENNIDPRYESRVQVRAFGVHGTKDQIPTEDLPWALVVAGNYSFNILPQQNHWVFGVFLDGRDAQQPLILGTIPTFMSDTLDPDRDRIGEHPKNEDEKAQSADSAPERVGQVACHPLKTAEHPEEGHPLEQMVNCIKDVKVASNPNAPNESFTSWSENATAYNAKYPHNNVYCSPDNKTTVELDSTPGAERLMIWHRGSYIQVDSNGTRTDKSYGDHQEVNDKNNMVYIGGRSSVTIMGDSHVYVDGNKTEEINGDLIQIVRGNHILGVGGQSNINASEEVQIRAAQLRMESNVSGINLKAAKGLFAQTGESMHFKSGIAIFQEATNSFNMKAGDNIFIQCDSTLNLKAQNTEIESADTTGVKGNNVKIGGGALVNIDATAVNIDDLVFLADGRAIAPEGASDATAADPAVAVEAPEPPAKSTSISGSNSGRNRPNVGTAGAASTDDPVENAEITSGPDDGLRGNSAVNGLAALRAFIAEGEGGYSAVNRGTPGPTSETSILGSVSDGARRNGKLIEELTFREIFDLQDLHERDRKKYGVSDAFDRESDPNGIFAVGRYQIVPDTLRDVFPYSGLSEDDTFSRSNQDILANTLILGSPSNNWYKQKNLSLYIRGESNDLRAAEVGLAREWASIPHPDTGQSVYGSGNRAKKTTRAEVRAALIEARRQFSGGDN